MSDQNATISASRIGWTADIHLNFVDAVKRRPFFDSLIAAQLDALIIAGDISVGEFLAEDLHLLADAVHMPIYFSLGNHDWWLPGDMPVHQRLAALLDETPFLHWLDKDGVVELGNGIALVGADTWVDNPLEPGYARKPKDWIYIEDIFPGKSTDERLALSQDLAQQAAIRLRTRLLDAAQGHRLVIAVTHIPPIFDTDPPSLLSAYQISAWLGSPACGAAMSAVAAAHPNTQFMVLSGHLHARSQRRIAPNLEIRIAEATYYEPRLHEVLTIGPDATCTSQLLT